MLEGDHKLSMAGFASVVRLELLFRLAAEAENELKLTEGVDNADPVALSLFSES